ncbi:unnamed protein product, partial [Timema podura]|nr:unnamed protein product [Timema podura]
MGSHGVGPRNKEGDKGSHGVGPRNKEREYMVNLCLRNNLVIAQLSEKVDLSGLEVLEEDQRSIRSHRVELDRQARLMLTQGLNGQNQSQ